MKKLTLSEALGITFLLVFLSLGIYGVFDVINAVSREPAEIAVSASAGGSGSCVVRRASCASERIALTFDDGPHERYTEEILEILDKYGIKATFFVIGTNADAHPELIKKELAAGHEVENHTLSHIYLKKVTDAKIKEEMMESQSIIAAITDYKTKYIRPPGGLYDGRLTDIANELGYKIVLWSLDTCDWAHPTPENIAANVLEDVRSGDIILMHDFIGGSSPTPMALEIMLPKLLERGFEFVTVSELLEE